MPWIDDVIVGIHDTYYTSCPYELCNVLNIKIIYVDYKNLILAHNDSSYIRSFFGQEAIFIRDDLDLKCEKFILAHELGHAILHTNIQKAYYNKDLINKGKFEKQATYFAFKFLNIEFDPVEYNGYTMEQISSILHIPVKHLKEACNDGHYTKI